MSLAPALLLSMPQLVDPNFVRTVILLCEHSAEGAFGLVVNRPAEATAAEAVEFDPPLTTPNATPLLIGGPVEPHRGWILSADSTASPDARPIGARLYLSASPDVLRDVLTVQPAPRRTAVLAGYAGWGPGQLDAELAESAWLIARVELDLIFEVPSAVAWEMAIRRLGADPSLLQAGHGVH